MKLKEFKYRVAKSQSFSHEAIKKAKAHYEEGDGGCTQQFIEMRRDIICYWETGSAQKWRSVHYEHFEENHTQKFAEVKIWWNWSIGIDQQKSRYLSRKWHKAKKEAESWKYSYLCLQENALHEQLIK